MWHPRLPGSVLGGVNWPGYSVVLLKPDCLRRGLENEVLERVSTQGEIIARETVTVRDWQIHVHYADLLVDSDWFSLDVAGYLRHFYIGQDVVIALVRGFDDATPARVRALLGHYDPQRATAGTIRGDLGTDSQEQSRAEGRLIENLVHSSDDAATVCRDFGTWFGANRYELLDPAPAPGPSPNPMEDIP
ncbi:MAG TPA: nucleoside-diphosphate kinase [Trebonia sp.]|nr:nucleoside-diphosphate kinase [Trebonia sp.]